MSASPEKEITAIQKATVPLRNSVAEPASGFSIQKKLQKQEEEEQISSAPQEEDLPANHFSETDLQNEWKEFLKEMQSRDVVIFNAIHGFTMHKEDENTIRVTYPSSTAKAEFDKVSHDFFNHFKHKVHHYRIQVQYHMDAVKLKKEIVTKRNIFEQFAKINPVLKQLDEKFKLDFN